MYIMPKLSPLLMSKIEQPLSRLPIDQTHLLDILSLVRPANSKGEQVLVQYITDLLDAMGVTYTLDGYGNISVNLLPETQTKSRVMFTAHTDTVHRDDNVMTQQLVYLDDEQNIVGLPSDSKSSCLGADDGTGCWVLLKLIEAKIPALYVFFRAEEIGGLGSEYYCTDKANTELLKSLTHCISFDRKGYHDIIVEQWAGRCASDTWATAFADELNSIDNTLRLSPNVGTFTDSANFTDVIAECTNISVGYDNQHSEHETQDVAFVDKLVNALLKVDWLNQSSHRNPADSTPALEYADYYDYLDDELEEHIYHLQSLGAQYAEDLVFNEPQAAIDLLTYLAKNR